MRSARIAPDWIAMATNFLRQLSIADWLIALVLFVGLFFVFFYKSATLERWASVASARIFRFIPPFFFCFVFFFLLLATKMAT